MNKQLFELYKATSKASFNQEVTNLLSPPLLLRVSDKYQTSLNRVMVIGQETQGWGCNDTVGFTDYKNFLADKDGIERLSDLYEGFAFAKNHSHSKSPFWRAFRQIGKVSYSDVSFNINTIWNNLIKTDYNRASIKALKWEIQEELVKYSKEILLSELKILSPKVCILFTGPNYDGFLNMIFDQVNLSQANEKWSSRKLARFEWNGITFYRTYHPNYLHRSGNWELVDWISQMVQNQ